MKTEKNNAIILVGMPASGKSTVGRLVAEKIGFDYIDTDCLIETAEACSITQIFARCGENYFRALETAVLEQCIQVFNAEKNSSVVLSTGGGMLQNPLNVELLKQIGTSFYLEILPDKIFERIKIDKTRPLLRKPDPLAELRKLYLERKENYELADCSINADDLAENIANRVIEAYGKING